MYGDDSPLDALQKELTRLDGEVKRQAAVVYKVESQMIQCMERLVEIANMIEARDQH
jgi:hypothetical protein